MKKIKVARGNYKVIFGIPRFSRTRIFGNYAVFFGVFAFFVRKLLWELLFGNPKVIFGDDFSAHGLWTSLVSKNFCFDRKLRKCTVKFFAGREKGIYTLYTLAVTSDVNNPPTHPPAHPPTDPPTPHPPSAPSCNLVTTLQKFCRILSEICKQVSEDRDINFEVRDTVFDNREKVLVAK